MSNIKLRIAAKTNVGLVRTNNEDNFQTASDLASGQMRWVNNEVFTLGPKGTLLVVADGMGGMNAGEVASEIAINTIRDRFAVENLTDEVMHTRFSIEKFMNDTVVEADNRIKQHAAQYPETHGMGTTIVIGWILDGKLYVTWCGDSRAYIFNPKVGLHRLTTDHSYVQSLIDKGALTEEEAFDYPDSNIITRSLCDAAVKAKPESLLKPYDLCDDDIVLLCTDGLCGMIRDNEIEAVVRNYSGDLNALTDELIAAACNASGADNITVCVAQILEGAGKCEAAKFTNSLTESRGKKQVLKGRSATLINGEAPTSSSDKKSKVIIYVLAAAFILACCVIAWLLLKPADEAETPDEAQVEDVQTEVEEQVATPFEPAATPDAPADKARPVLTPDQVTPAVTPSDRVNPHGRSISGEVKDPVTDTEPNIQLTPSDPEPEAPAAEPEKPELTPAEPAEPETPATTPQLMRI